MPAKDMQPSVEATSPATLQSIIDWPLLHDRFNGKHDFVRKLAISVLDSHQGAPAKFCRAAQDDDREALQFMAHSLKGVGGSLGSATLHGTAKELEEKLIAGGSITKEAAESFVSVVEIFLAELRRHEEVG